MYKRRGAESGGGGGGSAGPRESSGLSSCYITHVQNLQLITYAAHVTEPSTTLTEQNHLSWAQLDKITGTTTDTEKVS